MTNPPDPLAQAIAQAFADQAARSVQREPTPWDEIDQTSKDYYVEMGKAIAAAVRGVAADPLATLRQHVEALPIYRLIPDLIERDRVLALFDAAASPPDDLAEMPTTLGPEASAKARELRDAAASPTPPSPEQLAELTRFWQALPPEIREAALAASPTPLRDELARVL